MAETSQGLLCLRFILVTSVHAPPCISTLLPPSHAPSNHHLVCIPITGHRRPTLAMHHRSPPRLLVSMAAANEKDGEIPVFYSNSGNQIGIKSSFTPPLPCAVSQPPPTTLLPPNTTTEITIYHNDHHPLGLTHTLGSLYTSRLSFSLGSLFLDLVGEEPEPPPSPPLETTVVGAVAVAGRSSPLNLSRPLFGSSLVTTNLVREV